jgi:tetratricopeptide (TPR) repeat protein
MQLDMQSKVSSNLDKQWLFEVLRYAKDKGYKHLILYAEAFMKYYFIDAGSGKELREIYNTYLPQEWKAIKHEDPITYHRIIGLCHYQEGRVDSAIICYNQFEGDIEQHSRAAYRAKLYIEHAGFYLAQHQYDLAITHLVKAKDDAEESRYLPYVKDALTLLVDAYKNVGDYKSALEASDSYRLIDAQLLNLSQSEDLIALQIKTENQIEQEMQRQVKDEIRRKHNLQYMLILLLIITLFILLMMLVKYHMPVLLIRSLGFVALIFAFEFIILLADHEIHHFTHGVPWKILGIKVILISFMLPLHHWVEKKVLKYLLNKRKSKLPFLVIPWQKIKKWVLDLNVEDTT